MPVSINSTNPIGTIQVLKNGGPTVIRWPVTASLMVGNIVANRIKNGENRSTQLFNRKAASRDAHDSKSFLARRRGNRYISHPKLKVRITTMKIENKSVN